MKIQDIINNLVNWIHSKEINEFNLDYSNLIKGKQFPNNEAIVNKQLDQIIQDFDGHKISTDFSSKHSTNIDIVGSTNDNQ
jgi:hypothetical protein